MVSELLGLGGNGSEDLEDLGVGLAVDEFGGLLNGDSEVLLDEDGGLGVELSLRVELSTLKEDGFSFSGEAFGEKSADFTNDGSSFFVLTYLLVEFLLLFSSFGIKVVLVLLVACKLSSLGSNDSLKDFSGGVEVSFELGLKDDLLVVGLSKVLVKSGDIVVAGSLEFLVVSIVLLLLSNQLVFKSTEGLEECVKGVVGLQLKLDGIKKGSSELGRVDLPFTMANVPS